MEAAAPGPQRASAVTVRDARASELGVVSAMLITSYDDYRHLANASDACSAILTVDPQVWGTLGRVEVLVAECQGRLSGAALYYPTSAGELPTGRASVGHFGVIPERRGRGVGGALLDACLARARTDGATALCALSAEHMAAARYLYERARFRRAPEYDFLFEGEIAVSVWMAALCTP